MWFDPPRLTSPKESDWGSALSFAARSCRVLSGEFAPTDITLYSVSSRAIGARSVYFCCTSPVICAVNTDDVEKSR